MFNSELKQKFIEHVSAMGKSRETSTKYIFTALEPFENEWQADVCTRSAEELSDALGEIAGFRKQSKRTRMSILREYCKWCLENNVPGACEGILNVKDDEIGLNKLRRQMVANPRHLQQFLDSFLEKEEECNMDCVYRAYFWLAFSGVREEELSLLQASNLDFINMVIRVNGNEYPIYRESIPSLKRCAEEKEFKLKHPNIITPVYRKRVDGDWLLRNTRGEDSSSTSTKLIRIEISRKLKNSKNKYGGEIRELRLSYYRARLSGIFYRKYEEERAGIEVDFGDIVAEDTKGKVYNLSSGRNRIEAKYRQLARDYMTDYTRWKEAYSI